MLRTFRSEAKLGASITPSTTIRRNPMTAPALGPNRSKAYSIRRRRARTAVENGGAGEVLSPIAWWPSLIADRIAAASFATGRLASTRALPIVAHRGLRLLAFKHHRQGIHGRSLRTRTSAAGSGTDRPQQLPTFTSTPLSGHDGRQGASLGHRRRGIADPAVAAEYRTSTNPRHRRQQWSRGGGSPASHLAARRLGVYCLSDGYRGSQETT